MKIGSLLHNSLANGNDTRTVIFFAGCHHACSGCHNTHLWSCDSGREMSLVDVFCEVMDNVPIITGVTLSGGEPFLQAKDAYRLARAFHENDLDVWCYTGYTYEELLEIGIKNPYVSLLLEEINVLVDGKFIENLKTESIRYIGSTNQRIIKLKEGIRYE